MLQREGGSLQPLNFKSWYGSQWKMLMCHGEKFFAQKHKPRLRKHKHWRETDIMADSTVVNCCSSVGWEGMGTKAVGIYGNICMEQELWSPGDRAEVLALLCLCFLGSRCYSKGDAGMTFALRFNVKENWYSLRNKENLKLVLKLFIFYLMPRKIFYT